MSGRLSGEFHLTGDYERPVGFGAMTIDDGVAYGEPFQNGDGVAAVRRRRASGSTASTITKATGDDHRRRVRRVGRDVFVQRRRPAHSGRAHRGVRVSDARRSSGSSSSPPAGNSTFDAPRNDVKFRISDLSVARKPVGQVTGTLALRGTELSGQVDAASPRLAVTGTGRIALTPEADVRVTFRFHDSSLDPYVRLFVPKLSPSTTAVASGSIRIAGELADIDHLAGGGTVDALDMTAVRLRGQECRADPAGARPARRSRVEDLQLVGDETPAAR